MNDIGSKSPDEVMRIPFETHEDRAKFRRFLKATGRKAGPFVRTLILKAMDDEAKRETPHA